MLKNQIAILSTSLKSTDATKALELPSLGMNTPNPFTSRTVINYYLPSSFANSSSYIVIYDASGSLLNRYRITYTGKGNVSIGDLSKLSSGTYTYSLEIDGKIYDSKKMILYK